MTHTWAATQSTNAKSGRPGSDKETSVLPDDPREQLRILCRRLVASDSQAYETIFRQFYSPLLRYAESFTHDREMASDIVQDVYVKLWEMRASLDPNRSLKALLYRMVRNLALNVRRNQKGRQEKLNALTPISARPDDDTLDAERLGKQLRSWIDELPERQREALLLSRYEGLQHDEIAAVMKVSPRTVNNHVVKALRFLRNRVRAYEPALLRA